MSRRTEIIQFMNKKLAYINAVSESGEGKAMFASLRKGAGRIPGESPELFGVLLTDMPEEFLSESGTPTKEEWACYTALTLYAMHQQGNNPKIWCANTKKSMSIGAALAKYAALAADGNAYKRMALKLQALSSSKDMAEFSWHLKSIINLLKTRGVQLNYADFAGDIFLYQIEERRSGLFLKWGQDFYRREKTLEVNQNE